MRAGPTLEAIRAALPDELQSALANVTFELRDTPTAIDFARGATTDHYGYFFGDTRELGDETETALPDQSAPHGVIVIFLGQIKPLTTKRFVEVVCHEILHVLGYEEHVIVNEFGLAP